MCVVQGAATCPSGASKACPAPPREPGQPRVRVDPCAAYTNCIACARHLDCGWCAGGTASLPSCRRGGPGGAAEGTCPFWQKGFCTEEDAECAPDLSCEECVGRHTCAYNKRRGLCETAAAERRGEDYGAAPVVHSARACSTGSFEEAAHYAALDASPAPVEHPTGTVDPYALQPRRLGGLREPLPSPVTAAIDPATGAPAVRPCGPNKTAAAAPAPEPSPNPNPR